MEKHLIIIYICIILLTTINVINLVVRKNPNYLVFNGEQICEALETGKHKTKTCLDVASAMFQFKNLEERVSLLENK